MNATWLRAGLLSSIVLGTTVRAQGRPSSSGAPTRSVLRPEFRVSIEGGTGYESNVRFQPVDGVGDVANRARADVAAMTRFGRTTMVLLANGDLTSYQKVRDLNRWDYSVGLDLSRMNTARVSTHAALHAMTSLTPVLDSGSTALALGPLSRTRSLAGSAGFERRMTTRTSLSMTGDVRDVRYSVAGLAGGMQADGALTLQHRPGGASAYGFTLASSRTSLGESAVLYETATGNWSTTQGAMSYAVRAGARMMGGDSLAGAWSPHPELDADVSRRVLGFVAHARGGYSVAPTLGVGSVLASRFVGIAVDRSSPRGTAIRLSVDRAVNHEQGRPARADTSVVLFRSSDLSSLSAGLDVRRNFGTATWISASVIVRQSVGDLRVASNVFSLGFGRTLF